MSSLISIYIGALLTLRVALYHTRLYRRLNWSEEFQKIGISNARIIYTINLALTILFFVIGVISILYARELSEGNGLAFGFNLSYSGFWVWRLIWQITYQKMGKYQKSDKLDIAKLLIPFLIAVCYMFPLIQNIL